jgi:UDP-glucose 6-dehydrogenase
VGSEDESASEVMGGIYRPLSLNQSAPVMLTRRRTAELIKYAANAFLAVKITFINEIADLCEAVNGVEFANNAYHAAEGADALVIVTEWDAFRALDLRNIYPRDEAERAGFTLIGIGKG